MYPLGQQATSGADRKIHPRLAKCVPAKKPLCYYHSMPDPGRVHSLNDPRAYRILFFLLLLAAVLITFRHGIHAKMTGDAHMIIYNNPLVTAPDGILGIFQGDFCDGCGVDAPINVSTGFYRPLVNAVFWLEYRFAGTNDAIYNFNQILFHWACALMVFFLAARLLPDKPLAPFIAATLFALHPANAYAATRDARADALCLLFYLGALIAYLRAFSAAAAPRKGFILLALACYLGAILSKEMGVTLPAVLVMLHLRMRYREGRPARETLYTLPFWLLFAAYMTARAFLLPHQGINPYFAVYEPHVLYINVIKNFSVYLLRYLLPLGAGYPTLLPKMMNFIDPALADTGILLSAALGALIIAVALFNIRRHPTAAFLTFFLLITMTPLTMINRITDITDINVINTPERFMYIPSVPLLLLAALLMQNAYDRPQKDRAKKGAAIAGAGLALFLGSQSNIHTIAINSDVAKLKSLYLLPDERLTPKMRALRECFYVQFVDLPKHKYADAERRMADVLKDNPAMPMPYAELGFVFMETKRWALIPPLVSRWNNLTPEDIFYLKKQNPTVQNEYLGAYHNFPFMLGAAAARRGDAGEAADLFCSAFRRGYNEEQVIIKLRENYLLNGPPQCLAAKDEALCVKNVSIPDFAEWRQPLDPKRCEKWKNLF